MGMNFIEALKVMKQGGKVKLPVFGAVIGTGTRKKKQS